MLRLLAGLLRALGFVRPAEFNCTRVRRSSAFCRLYAFVGNYLETELAPYAQFVAVRAPRNIHISTFKEHARRPVPRPRALRVHQPLAGTVRRAHTVASGVLLESSAAAAAAKVDRRTGLRLHAGADRRAARRPPLVRAVRRAGLHVRAPGARRPLLHVPVLVPRRGRVPRSTNRTRDERAAAARDRRAIRIPFCRSFCIGSTRCARAIGIGATPLVGFGRGAPSGSRRFTRTATRAREQQQQLHRVHLLVVHFAALPRERVHKQMPELLELIARDYRVSPYLM